MMSISESLAPGGSDEEEEEEGSDAGTYAHPGGGTLQVGCCQMGFDMGERKGLAVTNQMQ